MATPNSETEVYNLRLLPGAKTVWRSALPGNIARTAAALADPQHGIKTVVDLREPSEILEHPDILPPQITHLNIPLYDAPIPRLGSLEKVYGVLLHQRSANIAAACNAILSSAAQGVLFHCTAGKDRTGLIAALMLAAAGMPKAVIVADYELSSDALPRSFQRQSVREIAGFAAPGSAAYQEAVRLHTESPGTVLVAVLRQLEASEGSVRAYLAKAGVTAENLRKLAEIFTLPRRGK